MVLFAPPRAVAPRLAPMTEEPSRFSNLAPPRLSRELACAAVAPWRTVAVVIEHLHHSFALPPTKPYPTSLDLTLSLSLSRSASRHYTFPFFGTRPDPNSITNPMDLRIREFGPFLRKTVADSNAPVQEKALDADDGRRFAMPL